MAERRGPLREVGVGAVADLSPQAAATTAATSPAVVAAKMRVVLTLVPRLRFAGGAAGDRPLRQPGRLGALC
jgi:hypothetical protein